MTDARLVGPAGLWDLMLQQLQGISQPQESHPDQSPDRVSILRSQLLTLTVCLPGI